MNDSEIRAMWLYASERWPNYPLPPSAEQRDVRLVAWRDEFSDVPADAIRRALGEPDLAAREWFPPLGLIRTRALLAAAAATGDNGPPALDVAWREVQSQIRRIGQSGTVLWSHPAIAETVESVGWRNLCMANEGDMQVFRQWREFYGLAAGRARAALAPGPVAALDGSGHPRGLTSGEPV